MKLRDAAGIALDILDGYESSEPPERSKSQNDHGLEELLQALGPDAKVMRL